LDRVRTAAARKSIKVAAIGDAPASASGKHSVQLLSKLLELLYDTNF
jgi:hypothetical protein